MSSSIFIWHVPVVCGLHWCKGVCPLTTVDVALWRQKQNSWAEENASNIFPRFSRCARHHHHDFKPLLSYLILGFHQRVYCVISCQTIDHFSSYLPATLGRSVTLVWGFHELVTLLWDHAVFWVAVIYFPDLNFDLVLQLCIEEVQCYGLVKLGSLQGEAQSISYQLLLWSLQLL